jgi:hypothetical protein
LESADIAQVAKNGTAVDNIGTISFIQDHERARMT